MYILWFQCSRWGAFTISHSKLDMSFFSCRCTQCVQYVQMFSITMFSYRLLHVSTNIFQISNEIFKRVQFANYLLLFSFHFLLMVGAHVISCSKWDLGALLTAACLQHGTSSFTPLSANNARMRRKSMRFISAWNVKPANLLKVENDWIGSKIETKKFILNRLQYIQSNAIQHYFYCFCKVKLCSHSDLKPILNMGYWLAVQLLELHKGILITRSYWILRYS